MRLFLFWSVPNPQPCLREAQLFLFVFHGHLTEKEGPNVALVLVLRTEFWGSQRLDQSSLHGYACALGRPRSRSQEQRADACREAGTKEQMAPWRSEPESCLAILLLFREPCGYTKRPSSMRLERGCGPFSPRGFLSTWLNESCGLGLWCCLISSMQSQADTEYKQRSTSRGVWAHVIPYNALIRASVKLSRLTNTQTVTLTVVQGRGFRLPGGFCRRLKSHLDSVSLA